MDVSLLAKRAADIAGLPAEWIAAQWKHETGDFTSELVADNNFGGLKDDWGNYMSFPTPEAFADYFGRYLRLYKVDGIYNAVTVDQYVASLKNGGYFEDGYENYLGGVKRFLSEQKANGDYSIPNTVTVRPPNWWEKITNRITSPLDFEKKIQTPDETKASNQSYINQMKDFLTKGLKAVGLVFVGLVMMVFGVYILSKDNVMILKKEGE